MPSVMAHDPGETNGDLTESQWLFTEDDLEQTPSVLAGLSPAQERQNRAKGINFIIQTGIMLKLPQITLSTASVYLHRFFMRHTMIADKSMPGRPHHHYYSVAAACLFLATKVSL
jgi:protein BUR2